MAVLLKGNAFDPKLQWIWSTMHWCLNENERKPSPQMQRFPRQSRRKILWEKKPESSKIEIDLNKLIRNWKSSKKLLENQMSWSKQSSKNLNEWKRPNRKAIAQLSQAKQQNNPQLTNTTSLLRNLVLELRAFGKAHKILPTNECTRPLKMLKKS